MQLDISKIRQETPGCSNVTHLNNAGAALMPNAVIKAYKDFFELESNIGGYEAARKNIEQIENVYSSIARLISCQKTEVAIVENATRAWDMAFYSIPFRSGDRILTCKSEYASNYIPMLQLAKKIGVEIEIIPNDSYGQVSVAALKQMIDARVRLVAITHIPTNGGLINPAIEIGEVTRQNKILFLLDACQSIGHIPIDVNEIGCDMLSATSRKYLRGPRGVGFLYVRSEVINQLEPILLDLRSATWTSPTEYVVRNDARRFENWEANYCARVAMGAAIDYALNLDISATWQRIQELSSKLRLRLENIPQIQLLDLGKNRCGIVSFNLQGLTAAQVHKHLSENKINVSIADIEDTRLDMGERGINTMIRASVHYYNTPQELDLLCEKLKLLAA